MKNCISMNSLIFTVFFCIIMMFFCCPMKDSFAASSDQWWDEAWPYRVELNAANNGVIGATINFSTLLNQLGLNHGLLDIRSLRLIAYQNGIVLFSIPYQETYKTVLEDGDSPQLSWSSSELYWSINDGYLEADTTRFFEGTGSIKAVISNSVGGYEYPGVEFHIPTSLALKNWSAYETLVYDVWPEVNNSALDQAPDLYWLKVYNACNGDSVTQGGPQLALNMWNHAIVSLNPLDSCWTSDGLNLSSITRVEMHTRENSTVDGNSGLWDDGDVLTLWLDNLRLVDQDSGMIRWQSVPTATRYYLYFDTLEHASHPPATYAESLGSVQTTASVGPAERGGYYHLISNTSGSGPFQIWSAPCTEKILPSANVPIYSNNLTIKAARGEFEPFQLVVKSSTTQSLTVNVSVAAPLTAPTFHRVDYVPITTKGDHYDRPGSWPDPLWPMNLGDSVSFMANQSQPLWFTFFIPWDCPAGTYTGSILIGNKTIPFSIEVWNFTMPREIHLHSEWGFGWSSIVEYYRGTIGGSVQSCYWDVVNALKQDFINHRLTPKGVAWPAGLNYPGGVEYDCNGNLDPDAWGVWDFHTLGGQYVHGQGGFNDGFGFPTFLAIGPTSNYPPDSLPYSFCGVSRSGVLGSATYRNEWQQYLAAVDSYITAEGYAQAAYYHIVNEPQSFDDYTIVGQISALTQNAAPNLRQLVSEQVEPDIYNYPGADIDIWMPTITNYEPMKSKDRQVNFDENVWWYFLYGDDPPLPNPILMSHPGLESRMVPWLAWAERVDGLLHYSTTDWSENPWTTPNVTGKDNGDGFFFYPAHKDGSNLSFCGENGHRLVTSIRWENLRDGMEDYEYLWLLNNGKAQWDISTTADSLVHQIVKSRTRFSLIPTEVESTRQNIAQEILNQTPRVPTISAIGALCILGLLTIFLYF